MMKIAHIKTNLQHPYLMKIALIKTKAQNQTIIKYTTTTKNTEKPKPQKDSIERNRK